MNKNRIEKPDNIMFGSPWFCACPLPDSIPLRGHLPIVMMKICIGNNKCHGFVTFIIFMRDDDDNSDNDTSNNKGNTNNGTYSFYEKR